MFRRMININDMNWDRESRTFSEEASYLKLTDMPDAIRLYNPKTKRHAIFSYWKRDIAGDEIAGWWYQCKSLDLKMLIIND